MSTIEKLSIHGIRSFGVDPDDEQKITFSSPLTLILGANGCGKTTIIECLKYAITGEMPGNTEKGSSFVHDSKLCNTAECLGRVRLKVRDILGNHLTISRSMKTTQKKNTIKFATLDSTIHFEGQDGKKDTISKRCVDVNLEMCQAMGVSKAIINNVIFCHQEDSNWPLDNSQKLKIKFDAIFGTTEYNKAIDKIIKLRKNYMAQENVKQADLTHLRRYKKETETKMLELQKSENKYKKLMAEIEELETELIPVNDRLDKIYKIEHELSKLHGRKVELSTNLENCRKQQEILRGKIKTIFDGTMSMLDSEIRTFKEDFQMKKNKLSDLEYQLNIIRTQEKKILSTLSDLEKKRVTLSYQRQQEQEFLSERANKINQLCQKLKIKQNHEFDSSNEIDDIAAEIKRAFTNELKIVKDLSTSHDQIDRDMQTSIDRLREKKASIENEIISKKKLIEQFRHEQNKIETQIDIAEKSAETLKNVSREIDQSTKKYNDYLKNSKIEQLKQLIVVKRENRDKFQENLDKIDEQIIFLNSFSKLTSEITVKQQQYELRENEVRRVKNKHSDTLKRLFYSKPIENNYKRNVQNFYETTQKEINDLNKNINKYQLKVTEYQTMRKNERENLNRIEKELTESEEKIYDQCRSLPYNEIVEKLKEKIAKTQLDHGAYKSSEILYKRYINKIENEPCCPLCHKDMTGNDVTNLATELTEEIHQLPDKIGQTERSLKADQKKYDLLMALKPMTERILFLKEEIPKVKQNLRDIEDKLSDALKEVELLQMSLVEPNLNLKLANSIIGDMSLLDEAIRDVQKIDADLKTIKSKLPENTNAEISMDDLQIERTTLAAELKNERTLIDKFDKQINTETDTANKLREIRNELKDRQIKLQEGIQALSQLKVRQKELITQINSNLTEITNAETKLQPLKVELTSGIENKEKIKNENRKVLNEAQTNLNELEKVDASIKRLTEQINQLAELNITSEIEHLKVTMKKSKDDQQIKNVENVKVTKEIENLKQELSNQELNERDLLDNRDLKLCISEEEEHQKKYNVLIKEIGDLDYRTVSKEKNILMDRQDEIRKKKNLISGATSELENQLESFNKILNEDIYKNSVKNYRKAFYESHVNKKIIKDLGQYRVALEWALIKFHSEKMQKINQLIREYWRAIYRGNDIDTIEIKTDEVKADADKKRSYNYRVVQSKRGVEIDFRGRCSAGQKVLASLIIRMALAETFSSNCGVLALDEPTTNLDRVNILSLCEVLQKVVEERQTQSNFMLIVITHDEEFIRTLGTIESYYKLSRNHNGKSLIQKVRP